MYDSRKSDKFLIWKSTSRHCYQSRPALLKWIDEAIFKKHLITSQRRLWSLQRWATQLDTPGRQLMKLKLVIHRLRPVIGFEPLWLSLPRAELNAPLTACTKHRQSWALVGMTRCERPSLPCLCHQAQPANLGGKERNQLSSSPSHLPVGFQDRERQLWRCKVVSEKVVCCWRREHALPQKVKERVGERPKTRRKRVPCHAFRQHSRTTNKC